MGFNWSGRWFFDDLRIQVTKTCEGSVRSGCSSLIDDLSIYAQACYENRRGPRNGCLSLVLVRLCLVMLYRDIITSNCSCHQSPCRRLHWASPHSCLPQTRGKSHPAACVH